MKKIFWSKSIWFFDIDDTLIDTATNSITASEGIRKVFENNFDSEVAMNIKDQFNALYNLMYAGYKVKKDEDWLKVDGGKKAFENLNQKVASLQKEIILKWGTYKKWSREIFIKLAADSLKMKVSPELIHEAADAYWITLAKVSNPFPDAVNLMTQIKLHSRPIFLITSSDARLKMRVDGQFEYIPQYSEGLKRERIMMLLEKGIHFNGISIGDPEDKPNIDFFQKAIKLAEEDLGQIIDTSHAIMVGDSFGGDLQTPKEKMGFGLVVLFQKDKLDTEVIDEHQITTCRLSDVANFLK